MSHTYPTERSHQAPGLFLITLGALLLAERSGYTVAPFPASFGVVLTYFGLTTFGRRSAHGPARVGGLLFCLVGVLLILNGIGLAHVPLDRLWALGWPAALIIVGLTLVGSRGGGAEGQQEVRLIGDYRPPLNGRNLTDRTIWTVIGDVRLDLTDATIREGTTRLTVYSIIGDTRILLPDGVGFEVSGSSIIGDLNLLGHRYDGIVPSATHRSDGYPDQPSKLRIHINSVIGNVRVIHPRSSERS